ncbi:MAG: DUF3717 domain-containing protein [Paralcaligenes sp.]
MKTSYTLAEMESAINYWRVRSPSAGEELCLCPQASALAEPYALMIFNAQREVASDALNEAAKGALAAWEGREGAA